MNIGPINRKYASDVTVYDAQYPDRNGAKPFTVMEGQVKIEYQTMKGISYVSRHLGAGKFFLPPNSPGLLEICGPLAITTTETILRYENNDHNVSRQLEQLTSQLYEQDERAIVNAIGNIKSRLVYFLLSYEKNGKIAHYYQYEIADIIGASKERVSSNLVKLKKDGLIDSTQSPIAILDREGIYDYLKI